MEFLIGFAGALFAVGIFLSGAVLGQRLLKARQRGSCETPDPEETRALQEAEEAYERLINYNVEDAYGLKQILPREKG